MMSKIWSYMPNKKYRDNIMHKLQNNEVIFLGRLLFINYFYYLQMQNGLHALFCELESSWEPTKSSMKIDPPDSLANLPSFGVILQQHPQRMKQHRYSQLSPDSSLFRHFYNGKNLTDTCNLIRLRMNCR